MKQLLKRIYHLAPLKKELFSALKLIWRPKEPIFRHLHFKGIIDVPVNTSTSFKLHHYGHKVENEIFWVGLTGGWEKESVKLWIQLCKRAETILDIGANTGVYSLIAKTINPSAQVYAFEPVTRVFKKLEENIKLNRFDIEPIEKAVSNVDGTAVLYNTPSDHTYSASFNKNFITSQGKVTETSINTTTLDSFITERSIGKVDLLKIDVETHEPEVLEGFSKYLLQFKPTMLIEILGNTVAEKVNNLLQGLDYLYFYIDERSGVQQVDKITQREHFNYLICSPHTAAQIGLVKGSDK